MRRRDFIAGLGSATVASAAQASLTLGLATAAHAQDPAPVSNPQVLGFSPSRLARIAAWQQTQVDAGAFSGAIAAIARNGKVAYLRAVGFSNRARTIPLNEDAIFRIASMTKPVTSVAAMMLVEEGSLDLAAPVYRYLPELKDMMVAVETRNPVTGDTELAREPQKRPMTVEDLLRHTAGLAGGVDTRMGRLYESLYESLFTDSLSRRDKTLADLVSALAKLPLAHQPGEVWEYSGGVGYDVLARVIEVASGQPFDQFLESRLFKPLGMVDTGFWVPPEKLARLIDSPVGVRVWDFTKPTKFFAGSGGLVSTATDYLRFCQMLLNAGELDSVRILKAETVRRMTKDALPSDIRSAGNFDGFVRPWGGSTFGLGVAVRSDAASSLVPGSVGSFSWDGVWGTYFWVDPAEQLIAVQLIQVAPGRGGAFQRMFRQLTYGALSVPDQGLPAAAAAPATIDAATLATYAGTYVFASISSRDKQVPFSGLGIEVRVEDGHVKVMSTIRDMPAAKAGILANDIVTHVDAEPLQGLTLNEVLEKLRGLPGTTARLRVERKAQDAPIEVAIVRSVIRPAGVDLQVAVKDGKLMIEASGALSVLDFTNGAPVALTAISENEFFVDGGAHTRLIFERDQAGGPTRLVLNPGPWQIMGQRIN
jgi:CubicO group peptidase (beta-lactamase class C family)